MFSASRKKALSIGLMLVLAGTDSNALTAVQGFAFVPVSITSCRSRIRAAGVPTSSNAKVSRPSKSPARRAHTYLTTTTSSDREPRKDKKEEPEVDEQELEAALDSVSGTMHRVPNAMGDATPSHQQQATFNKEIVRPYQPQRSWLWRQWRGTILQHSCQITLINFILSVTLVATIRVLVANDLSLKRALWSKSIWSLGVAPDVSAHPLIARFAVLEKVWRLQMGFVTFALTFFLGQAYSFWREVYTKTRQVQGRLNDLHLLLATHAKRERTESGSSTYTPAAKQLLSDVGDYARLFHILFWASHAKQYRILLTKTGLQRMVDRGIMTKQQLSVLQQLPQPMTQWHNACLEWMMIRWTQAIDEEGIIDTSNTPVGVVLLERATELRSTYAGIADKLDGRMPLAYVHLLQFLTDTLLFCAPLALYAEMGAFSVVSVAILTIFYGGFLDLGKVFLDPLNNEGYCRKSMYMDLGVLVRESNAGSVRWRDGGERVPW